MYLGNIMLIILNLPLVGLWVQLLRVPYSILAPIVILFTAIGSYSIANQAFDLYALIAFGVLGYVLRKLKIEAGPLPLAFILGPMIEGSLRQSLLMSGGGFSIFVTRPISLTLVALFALFVIGQMTLAFRRSRQRPKAAKTA
jgi:putative tricarboxylic transport membrane protein